MTSVTTSCRGNKIKLPPALPLKIFFHGNQFVIHSLKTIHILHGTGWILNDLSIVPVANAVDTRQGFTLVNAAHSFIEGNLTLALCGHINE